MAKKIEERHGALHFHDTKTGIVYNLEAKNATMYKNGKKVGVHRNKTEADREQARKSRWEALTPEKKTAERKKRHAQSIADRQRNRALKRLRPGWKEDPDESGKAPKHKIAAHKKKMKDILCQPMQKENGMKGE